MRKNMIGTIALAGIAAVGLTACGGGSSSSSDHGSGPTVKIMVGGIDKQIYLPYQLAEGLGLYKKYGVNVQLSTEQNGGVGAEEAMASGQVDMTGAWYIHAVDFQSKGKDVINVVQLSGAPGERLMCTPDSNVHSAADLAGKTVGVTDLGSGTDELTQFLASQHGIQKSQYHTIAVHAGSTAIAAIQRKSADCVMTTQPTVGALTSKNLAVPAVDLATTDGATKALGGAWPAAGLLARADWVKSNEDAVQKTVNALVETMHWINTHSAAEIADKLPVEFVSNSTITKQQYVDGLNTDKGQFLPDGIMPAGGPKVIFKMEQSLGVDTAKVSIPSTFTNKYAEAANKAAGTAITTSPAGADG